jgi:thiol:disulfide interchange protein DsbD
MTPLALLMALLLQEEAPKLRVESATPEKAEVRAGEAVKLKVAVVIEPTWHIYSVKTGGDTYPTKFAFEGGVVVAGVEEPAPKRHQDPEVPSIAYDYHEGSVAFTVAVTIPANTKPGPLELKGAIDYMPCTMETCLREQKVPFTARVTIAAGPPAKKAKLTIVSAAFDRDAAKPGAVTKLTLKVKVDPTWHIYSVVPKEGTYHTRFAFEGGIAVDGTIEQGPLLQKKDGEDSYDYLENEATFVIPVRIPADAKEPPAEIKGSIDYMPCTMETCLREEKVAFTATPGKVEAAPQATGGGAADEAARELKEKGLLWLIGISIAGGLLSLIMPCAYPLIPVTLTYFVKQAAGSRSKGLVLSSVYGFGIILTFTGIGFILTIALGAAGAQKFASNPWVNLGIAGMFGAFALSMFGLFEIGLPESWTSKLTGSRQTGTFGAFVLGCLFSIVSFTCTIPIAATIMGIAASSGNRAAGLLGMLVYSTTMALPFFFLGLFPGLIREIPRGGGWLHTVKVSTGFLEIALAIGYIWVSDFAWGWGFFDRWVVLSLWIGTSFVGCLYLLGAWRFKDDGEEREIGFGRLMAALLFGVIGFYLIGGLIGRPVGIFETILPPDIERAGGKDSGEKVPVLEDLAAGEELARKEKKPVFLEFTGFS